MYPADDPEEKRRASETLQAAAKLLDADVRRRSDLNFEQVKRPTKREIIHQLRQQELPK